MSPAAVARHLGPLPVEAVHAIAVPIFRRRLIVERRELHGDHARIVGHDRRSIVSIDWVSTDVALIGTA